MKRAERKQRIRKRLRLRSDRPRLTVFRSLKFVYAQIIDDTKGETLVAASGREPKKTGEQLALLAKKKKIGRVVFDRGAYRYHGRIKALAEAARAGGLEF